MRRLFGVPFFAGFMLAACSTGGGGSAGPAESLGESEAPSEESNASAEASVNPDDPLGFGDADATALVTIGDQTYEFGNLYCVTIGGALGAASVGGDPRVDINIPPEDWETSSEGWSPPSVKVNSDDQAFNLEANAELTENFTNVEAGQSQVDSFTTDGYRASGTATFFNALADMTGNPQEPVTGTFEVTCPRP